MEIADDDPRVIKIIRFARALRSDATIWPIILRAGTDEEFTEDEHNKINEFEWQYVRENEPDQKFRSAFGYQIARKIAAGKLADEEDEEAVKQIKREISIFG